MLPELLGITHRGYTQELQRVLTDFGLDQSFRLAAAKVEEHYGFEVPQSSLRRYAVDHAKRIAEQGDAQSESANCLAAQGVQGLIAQADGSMVAMVDFDGENPDQRKNRKVDYHEVRLCACQALGAEQTYYRAAIAEPDEFGRIWNQCAKDAGRGIDTFVHALGDGAPWIEQQAKSQLQCDRFLVDLYHLCEYLGAAEPACAENKHWLATQKNRLLRNRSDMVLDELKDHIEPPQLSDQQAPVRCAHRYLNNRTDQVDYKGSLEQEFPVGSGMIESGHKHVIQGRMKIPGAAWLRNTANAFIQARAHRASGRWTSFWKN
jgi:hypothetical protein